MSNKIESSEIISADSDPAQVVRKENNSDEIP